LLAEALLVLIVSRLALLTGLALILVVAIFHGRILSHRPVLLIVKPRCRPMRSLQFLADATNGSD
jgi:hypothetical protein